MRTQYRVYAILIALLISGGVTLYAIYSDEMNVKSSHREWAEIIKIEQKKHNLPKVNMKGTYTFYLVTVRLADGSTPTIRVINASNMKKHECLPVLVSLFFSGDRMTSVNNEKLLFSEIKNAPCGEQQT